jgi:hypothetical protein
MKVGVGLRRHSAEPAFPRHERRDVGPSVKEAPSMLEERGSAESTTVVADRDEHSMQLVEYGLAIVAVAAAVLLAVVR